MSQTCTYMCTISINTHSAHLLPLFYIAHFDYFNVRIHFEGKCLQQTVMSTLKALNFSKVTKITSNLNWYYDHEILNTCCSNSALNGNKIKNNLNCIANCPTHRLLKSWHSPSTAWNEDVSESLTISGYTLKRCPKWEISGTHIIPRYDLEQQHGCIKNYDMACYYLKYPSHCKCFHPCHFASMEHLNTDIALTTLESSAHF